MCIIRLSLFIPLQELLSCQLPEVLTAKVYIYIYIYIYINAFSRAAKYMLSYFDKCKRLRVGSMRPLVWQRLSYQSILLQSLLPNVFNHYLKKKGTNCNLVYLELYCFIYRNDWWGLVSQLYCFSSELHVKYWVPNIQAVLHEACDLYSCNVWQWNWVDKNCLSGA